MPEAPSIIDEVYIRPIKSVLFIDDSFPTYASLLTTPPRGDGTDEHLSDTIEESSDLAGIGEADSAEFADGFASIASDEQPTAQAFSSPAAAKQTGMEASINEDERALRLTSSCRDRGYIFDVENKADYILKTNDPTGFINKPDLIVLDYVLNRHTRSSAQALEIIRRLSNTPRYNLVVVYTTKSPMEVSPEIAIALRGKREVPRTKNIMRRTGHLNDELLDTYLLDYLGCDHINLPEWQKKLDAPKALLDDIVARFEERINARFSETKTEQDDQLVTCAAPTDGRPWIRGRNVFVVVVQKPADGIESIDQLIDSLRDALKHHDPEPIAMLMQQSVNLFRERGERILDAAFGDKTTRAALLYYALVADHPAVTDDATDKFRLADLTHRILATMAQGIQDSLQDFGTHLLAEMVTENGRIEKRKIALRREKVPETVTEKELLLCLNTFLCSHVPSTGHITSGTVFRNVKDPKEVWLCASPACDMVPGQIGNIDGCYRKKIHPASHFEAIRLKPVTGHEVKDAVQNATQCRHIFLKEGDTVKVYKTLHGGEHKPLTYVFYSAKGGIIGENRRTILTIPEKELCSNCGKPTFKLVNLDVEVIGQLRSEYANRLLTQKGGWNSRIGVHFVNLK